MPEKTINILVFPCGSEIGLEVYRSLCYGRLINLIGGSSTDDHGKFVYENYIGDIPYVSDERLIPYLTELVERLKIDIIYPATDAVISKLKTHERELNCIVAGPSLETALICSSKKRTYEKLAGVLAVPRLYEGVDKLTDFPVFLKPDVGYGSRGVHKAENKKAAEFYHAANGQLLLLEYLPGREYTIDCFTNKEGTLLFSGARERKRIMNGISVHSDTRVERPGRFSMLARQINGAVRFRGAWFFQVKENGQGEPVLMEIAARLGGTSGVYRCKGINFAMLTVLDAMGEQVTVEENDFQIEIDRALENKYRIQIDFDTVYVDFDDTVVINGKLNTRLMMLLYQFINEEKKLILLTKHIYDIHETLAKYRLTGIFDEVILLKKEQEKCTHIRAAGSIFIDDSFSERSRVHRNLGIPVFAPDAIESLLK